MFDMLQNDIVGPATSGSAIPESQGEGIVEFLPVGVNLLHTFKWLPWKTHEFSEA